MSTPVFKRKRHKSHAGVYTQESASRRHNGRPDQTISITYKVGERKIYEKVGRLSDGVTVQDAVDLRTKRMRSVRLGENPSATSLTVQAVWEMYEATLIGKPSHPTFKSMFDRHIAKVLGSRMLSKVTHHDVEKFKAILVKTKNCVNSKAISSNHAGKILQLLGRIFRYAIRTQLYYGNDPTKFVAIQHVDDERAESLKPEQWEALREHLRKCDPLLHDVCVLAINTGLRRGAIVNLNCGDIDFANGIIYALDGKNGKTQAVFMSDDAREVMARRANGSPGQPVFMHNNQRSSVNIISQRFKLAVDHLGFNDRTVEPRYRIVFHTLRHTFASWLVSEGVSLYEVSGLMGHSSISMTERYAKVDQTAQRAAVGKISTRIKRARDQSNVTSISTAV